MSLKKASDESETKALTPLQRTLQTIRFFRDNEVTESNVLVLAEFLTIESGDPKNAEQMLHIDNGIERLAGIAVQGSDGFRDNFVDALTRGQKRVTANGGSVTPHVGEIISALKPRPVAA